MNHFYVNKKRTFTKVLIGISCLALLLALTAVLSRYDSSDDPAPSISMDGTGISGVTSSTVSTETQTDTATIFVSNQTENIAPDPTKDTTSTEPPHSHSYSSSVTKEATCAEKGVKTYTCACGDSYTEDIDKLDHNYTSKTVKPTCTTKGYTTYTCACGQFYQDNETKATGHSWGDWTDAGEGKSTRKCSVCGKEETKTENSGSTANDSYNTAGSGASKTDPNGDPNGNPANYVAPADPKTGISWDGVSPIIYTYTDGTTGTEPKLGATFFVTPYRIGTVTAYTMGQISAEEYFGGGDGDGSTETCRHCGKPSGDGTNGTCVHWMVEGTHTCKHCGEAVPGKTCHTCPED